MCLCVLAVVLVLLLVLGALGALVVYSAPVACALVLWLYALAASFAAAYPRVALLLVALSLFVAFGDARVLATHLLRKYARNTVGERVELRWSVRRGVLELKHIALSKRALSRLESSVGFPVGFESVELESLVIELPLIDRFVYRKRQKHLRVRLTGVQISTTLFASKHYDWTRHENATRLESAILDAARARLARIDAWTAMIVQKLGALAPSASPLRASAPSTRWSKLRTRLINALAIDVQDVRVTVRDETKASSSVRVTLKTLTVSRTRQRCTRSTERAIELTQFEVLLCPRERLLFRANAVVIDAVTECAALLRTLTLTVSLTRYSVFPFRMHPRHLLFTRTSVLEALHHYSNWSKHAVKRDQQTCVDLTASEASEYVQLFYEQWTLDAATDKSGWFTGAEHKRAVATRRARIRALETNAHALLILELRAKALGWTLKRPSGATASGEGSHVLHRSNVSAFLQTLVETYAHERRETPDDTLTFHRVDVTINAWPLPMRFDGETQLHAPPPASIEDPFAVDEPFFSPLVAWALDKREAITSLWCGVFNLHNRKM